MRSAMAVANYRDDIKRSNDILKAFRKSGELFNKESELLNLEKRRYALFYSQIHEYLAPKKTQKSEQEIREHINSIYKLDLPVCESKAFRFKNAITAYEKRKDNKNVELCYQYLQEWMQLYEDFYALVAFRSLEHFALFMEWDKDDADKMWKYSIDTFGDNGYSGCTKGFFYYANQMVLSDNIEFILKQLPTNYGKSYSDSTMIAFIFGVNKDEQVVKVVGNNSLPAKCTRQVVKIMNNRRFLQVFPEYAKLYNGEGEIKDQIFEVCAIEKGLLTIKGSLVDTNYECFSKETKRDGIRCGFLFLDDIVQKKEMMKISQHQKDLDDFDGTWKKRCKDEKHFKIVCGGTTYDIYDLLCTLKFRFSGGKIKKSPINKYTYLNEQENAVFVSVPKLDENDQLTFPQKCKLETVLKDRRNNPQIFYAMDMQQPLSPDDTPFYWDYIRQYEFIPSDCTEYCQASLDPARTGDNYVSMPIFKVHKEMDNNGLTVERHYLIDGLYMKAPMDVCYGKICELIEKHHIIKLRVERNTDTSLKFLLDKMLAERGIHFCEITEVYSTKKKEDRIYADETILKNLVVFPCRDMYARTSQMGQFMEHIIAYKYKGAEYDDSIDSVCLYIDYFISQKNKPKPVEILYV